ncbi:MAG TPA: hypothetical protein DCR14_04575 [Acidimicrobiaceae bacterium]|nr:hypothetical protein [Acidimicrobiaceae bacterium]
MSPAPQYSYLWDGSEPGWVIWQLPGRNDETGRRLIFNLVDHTALIIEDDELAEAVLAEMVEHGCPTITEPPS